MTLLDLWAIRQCFVCGRHGPCPHREPEADRAWLDAQRERDQCRQMWLPGFAPAAPGREERVQ